MTNKPKQPQRVKRINLTGDYVGWWFDVRLNAPFGLLIDRLAAYEAKQSELVALDKLLREGKPVQSTDVDMPSVLKTMYDVLEVLVVDWNYVDYKSNKIPATVDGFKLLPVDLLRETLNLAYLEVIERSSPLANNGN